MGSLTAGTAYDLYLVTESNGALSNSPVKAPFATLSPLFTLALPEGGNAAAVASGGDSGGGGAWVFDGSETVQAVEAVAPPPPGVSFPHGVTSFRLIGGDSGSAATVVLTYPAALPAGGAYYKHGPSGWYVFPGAVIQGNTITLTLVDGGAGDLDGAQNSAIADPGGFGLGGAGVAAIPTLSQWGLLMLAGLLGLFSLGALRRRVGN